ncbi:hypothetical protein ACLOJK_001124 [Asimina triloba]
MAKPITCPPTIFVSLLLNIFFTVMAAAKADRFPAAGHMVGFGREKLSHLHFYFHDVVAGPNQTAVLVASGPTTNTSFTGFGSVVVVDDPLTEGPNPSSRLVGRAQGMYAAASQQDWGLLMAMNFAFVEGKYKGSTLAVLGRNSVLSQVREMPVLGGTGLFRFARGYALAKTYKLEAERAIVEPLHWGTLGPKERSPNQLAAWPPRQKNQSKEAKLSWREVEETFLRVPQRFSGMEAYGQDAATQLSYNLVDLRILHRDQPKLSLDFTPMLTAC